MKFQIKRVWVCDPNRSNLPEPFSGKTKDGYILWLGEKREVLDMHVNPKGIQLQLA